MNNQQIIEAIPNFSEGKNQTIIDQIAEAVKQTPQATLAHRTSDSDHNRTVLTIIGPPQAVTAACFQAIKTAAQLINLEKHQGVHPFIGATDVCPLVPLKNITIKELLPYAENLAQKVSQELNIPTYLYEHSAKNPQYQNLANVRKGNYQTLKQDITTNRPPDYGPHQLGTAGATVIGVRDILIAYNINIAQKDLSLAKRIAKHLRTLPKVKALGLYLQKEAKVQVSMNLIDYHTTKPYQVWQEIEKFATPIESELIGLIPKDALRPQDYQGLHFLEPVENQLLENFY